MPLPSKPSSADPAADESTLVLIGLATDIDAMVVGAGLAFVDVGILPSGAV